MMCSWLVARGSGLVAGGLRRAGAPAGVGHGWVRPRRREAAGAGGSTRAWMLSLLVLVGGVACRQDMHNQPRLEPFEASDFFADGMASRKPVEGTVARGELRADDHLYRGVDADGNFATTLPMPMTVDLLRRGRERYDIYCSPCHGRTGDGDGMVVRRGFKAPQSLHQDRLRESPPGYYFDVMTNGFGDMSGYAAQVPVEDRWAIAAYVQALQFSRHADQTRLAAADRAVLSGGAQPASSEGEGGH